MSALDIRQAKQSLTWWLREWGVTEVPDRKARQFIDDMVDRGWVMSAQRESRPHPPKPDQECRRHPGQPIGRCGGCQADHRAATYADDEQEAAPMDRETAAKAARDAIHAAKARDEGGAA